MSFTVQKYLGSRLDNRLPSPRSKFMDRDLEKMDITGIDENNTDKVFWGVFTTASEPYATYVYITHARCASSTTLLLYIILNIWSIVFVFGVHCFQIYIGVTFLAREKSCEKPLQMWHLLYGTAALIAKSLSTILVPFTLMHNSNYRKAFEPCRCLNFLRFFIELIFLSVGTFWMQQRARYECSTMLISSTVIVVWCLWISIIFNFLVISSAMIAIILCFVD